MSFQPDDDVYYIRSTGDCVPAKVVGPSTLGHEYLSVMYSRSLLDGSSQRVLHPAAPIGRVRQVRSPSRSSSRSPSRSRSRSLSPPPSRSRSPSPSRISSTSTPRYPPGWEACHTSEGVPFYVHHPTETTTWTPPSVLPSYKELQIPKKASPTGKKKPCTTQSTLTAFLAPKPAATAPDATVEQQPVVPPMELNCQSVGSKRRRSKEEVLSEPKRQHPSTSEKLRILAYADEYGVRNAARKFRKQIKSHGSITDWSKKRDALMKKAHADGGHSQTLHGGKKSKYHKTEGRLRRKLLGRRRHHVAVTKRMMMRWAMSMDPRLKALDPAQRDEC